MLLLQRVCTVLLTHCDQLTTRWAVYMPKPNPNLNLNKTICLTLRVTLRMLQIGQNQLFMSIQYTVCVISGGIGLILSIHIPVETIYAACQFQINHILYYK